MDGAGEASLCILFGDCTVVCSHTQTRDPLRTRALTQTTAEDAANPVLFAELAPFHQHTACINILTLLAKRMEDRDEQQQTNRQTKQHTEYANTRTSAVSVAAVAKGCKNVPFSFGGSSVPRRNRTSQQGPCSCSGKAGYACVRSRIPCRRESR